MPLCFPGPKTPGDWKHRDTENTESLCEGCVDKLNTAPMTDCSISKSLFDPSYRFPKNSVSLCLCVSQVLKLPGIGNTETQRTRRVCEKGVGKLNTAPMTDCSISKSLLDPSYRFPKKLCVSVPLCFKIHSVSNSPPPPKLAGKLFVMHPTLPTRITSTTRTARPGRFDFHRNSRKSSFKRYTMYSIRIHSILSSTTLGSSRPVSLQPNR